MRESEYRIELRSEPMQSGRWFSYAVVRRAAPTDDEERPSRLALMPGEGATRDEAERTALVAARSWIERQAEAP